MKDKCLAHLSTLAEAARELLNRLPVGEAEQLEIELVRAEDYMSVRPTSSPPSPIRIVRPAPGRPKLTLKQIQAAVKKVSKKNKNIL